MRTERACGCRNENATKCSNLRYHDLFLPAQNKTSPMPWRINDRSEIVSGKGRKEIRVCRIAGAWDDETLGYDDARLIVNAVNANAALIRALKDHHKLMECERGCKTCKLIFAASRRP